MAKVAFNFKVAKPILVLIINGLVIHLQPMRKALVQIHIAIFIWGFTGALGKAISLQEIPLVWWRLFITMVILGFMILFCKPLLKKHFGAVFLGKNKPDSIKEILGLMLPGAMLAIHWIGFYGSIKYANVSVALICLSTSALIAALLEPLVFKNKIKQREVLYGVLVVVGILIIYQSHLHFGKGIYYGLAAALFTVIASLLNKKMVHKFAPFTILVWQMLGAFLAISIVYLFSLLNKNEIILPTITDVGYILILSLVCTIITFLMLMMALQKISVFTLNLLLTLEPIYGIILAFIWFKEYKDISPIFYLGFLIIICTVVMHTLNNKTKTKHG
jgi:drug/metabolite transporter (DMT)-like permease